MFFILEFFVYLIYFLYKMYLYLDREYFLSNNGSKLKKYLTASNLKEENINSIKNEFILKKSNFLKYKSFIQKKIYILIIFISIFSLKFSISYSFFKTNFLYIKIFNKNIDLISFFSNNLKNSNNIIIFKLIYYILFSFFLINIIIKINSIIDNQKKEKKIQKEKSLFDSQIKVNIGKVEKEKVFIYEKGLYQNVLITGSIGSGKTSSAITNILNDLIINNIYGVVIDVKGNYINIVKEVLKKAGKEEIVLTISLDSEFKYNPIDKPNLTSMEIANRIRKILTLLSKENTSDSFWLDKSETYIQNFITIIRAYKDYVDFYELHQLVINKQYLEKKINIIKNNIVINKYSDKELFNINSAISNIKNEFFSLDDRTLNIIKAEITRITNIFVSDEKIYNQFCVKSDEFNIYKDKVIVLSINIGENEKLAKVVAAYLKLDFQKQVLSNVVNEKSIFFICDEYQEFANTEDSHFFSLSREYKCINVISMQSYNSLINALGNKIAAMVIIQNLVNKIWFRNDDLETVAQVIKQIGKHINKSKSLNFSETGQNTKYNFILKNFKEYKSGLSQSYSVIERLEYVINEEYLTQKLKAFETICLISDGYNIKVEKKVKMKIWGEKNENKCDE